MCTYGFSFWACRNIEQPQLKSHRNNIFQSSEFHFKPKNIKSHFFTDKRVFSRITNFNL